MLLAAIRRHKLFFALVGAAGLALRLLFVFRYRVIDGDAFVYGEIALNWLRHGTIGLTHAGDVQPTLIRLPGYPAFLAAVFSIAGPEHYGAALITQAFIDLATCLFIAALAAELFDDRAILVGFALAALCPFTANYTAAALTETLAIFTTAAALVFGVRGWKALASGAPSLRPWLACGLWIAASTYLRPDDILPLAVFGAALLIALFRKRAAPGPALAKDDLVFRKGTASAAEGVRPARKKIVAAAAVLSCAALLPLIPWSVRNWRDFHVFQPLAARYANDPDEFISPGFNRWVRTWSADFVSVDEIYWKVPNQTIDIDNLPERAFDSRQQYDATDELISDYNLDRYVDEDLDARFQQLARERISHSRFRYYAWLPLLRVADMWLRPRIEMLPMNLRWWEYGEHPRETRIAVALGLLNLFYLLAACIGLVRWRTISQPLRVLLAFVLLRSLFLSSLENPEPRYVLECFPVVLAVAAAAFIRRPRTT
jgi:4-amino-4-deoxy-L-arabinose transferase-like glycosyltransferase